MTIQPKAADIVLLLMSCCGLDSDSSDDNHGNTSDDRARRRSRSRVRTRPLLVRPYWSLESISNKSWNQKHCFHTLLDFHLPPNYYYASFPSTLLVTFALSLVGSGLFGSPPSHPISPLIIHHLLTTCQHFCLFSSLLFTLSRRLNRLVWCISFPIVLQIVQGFWLLGFGGVGRGAILLAWAIERNATIFNSWRPSK